MCVCVYIYIYICACSYMYVYVCVYIYMYIYIYIYIHIHIYSYNSILYNYVYTYTRHVYGGILLLMTQQWTKKCLLHRCMSLFAESKACGLGWRLKMGARIRVYGLGLRTLPSFRVYRPYKAPFKVPLRRFRV